MSQLAVIFLMMNSQEISATGYSPHELFMGPQAWFLQAPYPGDSYHTVGNGQRSNKRRWTRPRLCSTE